MRRASNQANTMQLVLLALLRCGGDEQFVSTDEVALEAFKLFPGKFCWDEYQHLPHWDRVRQWLSEAKKEKHGVLVEGWSGGDREGWKLTAAGVRLLRFKEKTLAQVDTAPYPDDDYRDIPGAHLIAAAIAQLAAQDRAADPALVVAQCFSRFPERFEMKGYRGWPDTCAVRDDLAAAIRDGLVVLGEQAASYELTERGRAVAREVLAGFARSIAAVSLAEVGKGLAGKAAKLTAAVTRSRAWADYSNGRPLTRGSACEAVRCTLQSHPNAVVRALESYYLAAEEAARPDVMQFLLACADVIGVRIRTQPAAVTEGSDRDGA